MQSAICTLFEGSYHYGVAALINSLYSRGYRGEVYVGYRGELPPWSIAASASPTIAWSDSRTLQVADDLRVHFLPLDTDYHFTNYKPDFMLRVWDSVASTADAMFYFDPDIVVTAPWTVFEQWTACGVALCEDINSPKAMHHPTRKAWRQYFGAQGFTLVFKEAIYANGGFVGVSKEHRDFLTTWQALQEAMAPAIGGLGTSFFVTYPTASPFAPFGIPDQDAMNATVEAWPGPVCFVDKAGMAFNSSASLMSHAIGGKKPWVRDTIMQLLAGYPPRRADQDYWREANGPIISQPIGLVYRRQLAIKTASFLGRFYNRN